jgi:hypothetical protein
VPRGYDFITHSLPGSSAMTALLEGSLAITLEPGGVHCLVVVGGSRDVTFVAWPDSFAMVMAGDGTVEVTGDGRVFRLGDEVRFGGGEIADRVHHSIPGACQTENYFAAETFP